MSAETSPLLSIKNLSVCFHQNGNDSLEDVMAVKNVSFDVHQGKTLAIVGESGSGKSVSAQSILKLLPPTKSSHPSGEILFKGLDLLKTSESEIRQIRGDQIGMIFQEPMTSLNPLHNIEKQISETLLLHSRLSRQQAKTRVIELLNLVGIPNATERLGAYPHQLSGGQKQRVMIAMALANEPDILIADEPTTALDVTVQKQVLELIKSLQKQLGMAVVLISHDLSIVRHYADEVVVMHQGQVIERGPCDTIFHQPQQDYTHQLIESEPTGSPAAVNESAETLLTTNKVNVWFPTKTNFWGKPTEYLKAAQDISISLRQGETLGIVGESGSGKTTFGLALLKLIQSQGDIYFENQAVHTLDQARFRPLRKEIQIVFQDPYGSLSPRMSVYQIIEEGLKIHDIAQQGEREQLIIDALIEVELDPETRHRYPHEFSGGQRQRIAIARALVLKPKLIILDEPTSALDRTVQVQVVELLRKLQSKYGLAYIFISHDLAVVKAVSHQVLVMKHGQVIEHSDCESLFTEPKQDYTKNLLEAAYFYTG